MRQPNRRALIDFLVIFGFALLLREVTYDMNLFNKLYDYTRFHEDWQLDELLLSISIASFAFIAFGLRRMQDQRRELALRLAAEQHATKLALQALGDERVMSARLGGDEFAVSVRNLATPAEAERIAERIVSAIQIPIMAAGVEHHLVEVSIGERSRGNAAARRRRALAAG